MNDSRYAAPHAADSDEFVRIADLVKIFGDTVAVRSVNLSVRRNELFALLGSSGCGKSTLLRMLAGFEEATSGQILLDGEDITDMPPYRRPVNMMFQSYALFPHMSVEANVAFGLKQEGVDRAEIHDRVFEALNLVQMAGYSRRKPHQLSGGQQQRVALARSLVKRPKLLLLDEPMSALDKQIRQATQIGTPQDVYEFPNSRFVAGFIGSTNLFPGTIVVDEPDHVAIESDQLSRQLYVSHGVSEPLGMQVYVSIRPERIVVSREQPESIYNWAHGAVTHMAWMGSYALYHIRLDSGMTVEATVPRQVFAQDDAPAVHEEVYVVWDADSATVLPS
jgi:putrescine transport system ATP-binding protein